MGFLLLSHFLLPLPVYPAAAAAVLALAAGNYLANHVVRLPRTAYTLLVVYGAGTLVASLALAVLIHAGLLAAPQPSPVFIAAAIVLGGLFLWQAVRSEPVEQKRRIPALLTALYAPSLAEVLVFVGLVFTLSEAFLRPAIGAIPAALGATAVTAGVFALYHLTHAAPWNSLRMLGTLFLVWLVLAGFYALTRDLWAVSLFNTLLATIGFVKNRVSRPQEQPLLVSVLFDVLGVATVVWLCL